MWMLGCLEIVEYSFNKVYYGMFTPGTYHTYVCEMNLVCAYHTVCCLSGTTCVLVVIQYTAVYLLQCVYFSYSKISLHYCYCCVLGTLHHSCVCRCPVIIELVSRMNSQRGCWVCWKSKKTYFYEILTPGTRIISVLSFFLKRRGVTDLYPS